MSNIMDYLDWRGDLSFNQSKLNFVDLVCLSQLALLNFSDLIEGDGVPLNTLFEKYMDAERAQKPLGVIVPYDINLLFKKMAESNRFCSFVAYNYKNIIDTDTITQFCAVTFQCDDIKIVAFSGTDDTIVGWEENFSLVNKKSTFGQNQATEYLNNAAKDYDGRLFSTGHSKGGNLVLYSFLHCDSSVAEKLEQSVCIDGPGLRKEDFNSQNFKQYGDKLLSILPQGSIIGRLFYHKENKMIVESDQQGLFQHDCFSWKIRTNCFEKVEKFSDLSQKIKKVINEILEEMDVKEKLSLVKSIFKMMYATESCTLTDLSKKRAALVLEYVKLEKEDKKILNSVIAQLVKSKAVRKTFMDDLKELRKTKLETKVKQSDFLKEACVDEHDDQPHHDPSDKAKAKKPNKKEAND